MMSIWKKTRWFFSCTIVLTRSIPIAPDRILSRLGISALSRCPPCQNSGSMNRVFQNFYACLRRIPKKQLRRLCKTTISHCDKSPVHTELNCNIYSVPNLQLDKPVLNMNRPWLKIHAHCDIVLIKKLPMQVLVDKRCLAHAYIHTKSTRFADYDHLETDPFQVHDTHLCYQL